MYKLPVAVKLPRVEEARASSAIRKQLFPGRVLLDYRRHCTNHFFATHPFNKRTSCPLLSTMDGGDELDGLRGLYQDLSALSRSALPNVERLVFELEATVQDFKKLLDKPPKKNESRQSILSGRIQTPFSLLGIYLQLNIQAFMLIWLLYRENQALRCRILY